MEEKGGGRAVLTESLVDETGSTKHTGFSLAGLWQCLDCSSVSLAKL